MKKAALAAAVVALCVAGQARAIEIDFTGYTAGDITGQTGWTASGGVDAAAGASWEKHDTANVVDDNLGTAGSETSANPIAQIDIPTGGYVNSWARLSLDGVPDDGWTLSGIVQYDGALGTEMWFALQLYRGGDEVFGIGRPYGADNWKLYSTDESDSGVAVVPGEAVLLVAQYDGSSVKMWVDPDLDNLGTPDDEDTDPGDLSGLDTLYIRGGSNFGDAGTFSADNISLIPEPATMSMLAVGGLGVLIRRRRRA